jgi:uncharacterized protein (DUF1778 family)
MNTRSAFLQIRVTPREKAALKRLAESAGQDVSSYVLARAIPSIRIRFEDTLRLLENEADRRLGLAELNDLLASLAPMELPGTLAEADLSRLSPFVRNYDAAMVEQAARNNGVKAPAWTASVAPLERPYFASPLKNHRLHLLRASPVPFKRRNLFVDSGVGARV